MRSPRVAEILSVIAARGDGQDSATLPARLGAECLSALPVSGVGVALMTAEGPSGVVLAATDERARQLEELQFALGEGPCVDASGSGRPVLQPDLAADGSARWPGFGAAVLDAGVHAIFAFPLRVGAIRVGVLDLYRDTPGSLSALDLADALAFAEAATVVVLHLQDHDEHGGSALTGPIDGQAAVHQATGMITVQLGVSLAEALLRLRAHAYTTGRTVSAVAADVVNRRLRFDDGEPGTTTQRDRP
ncbi:ANTAR domain-containing protein [Amycolatopsis arida]|uniref:ANTAR domain-containing protein n=1 Tax=Amycolatopsis arida TaxID=587909 RepID=A0A1I5M8T2_9PSEU|nr:GAF and ANTAR domain-containing protein [Amycolatopsis arida]TDX94010.1 GAF domain-containing protein [Amycolatopsis arida]SFP05949.1 ANTAR domain-containing protein [Amycolatopsis arida]